MRLQNLFDKQNLIRISTIWVFFLFLISLSYAVPIPQVIPIKIYDYPGENIPVTITNLRTSQKVSLTTNEFGEIVYDWNNVGGDMDAGDVVRIEVYDKSRDTYVYGEATFDGDIFNIIYFDLRTEKEKVIEKLPKEDLAGLLVLILVLLAVGVKFYTDKLKEKVQETKTASVRIRIKKDGTSVKDHMHRGIRGYHLAYTLHRNKDYQHARGDILPTKTTDGRPFPHLYL